MAPQPHDPTPDRATEHAAAYIVALVFTDSGHLRTTLVVIPFWTADAVFYPIENKRLSYTDRRSHFRTLGQAADGKADIGSREIIGS